MKKADGLKKFNGYCDQNGMGHDCLFRFIAVMQYLDFFSLLLLQKRHTNPNKNKIRSFIITIHHGHGGLTSIFDRLKFN